MINIEEVKLYNPGVLLTKVEDELLDEIKRNMYAQINPEDSLKELKLHEFSFSGSNPDLNFKIDTGLTKVLSDMFSEYTKRFNYHPDKTFVVSRNAWVNYQKKCQFNQLHYHTDAVVYILYLQIPYDVEEELKKPNNNIVVPPNPLFEFVYSRVDGELNRKHLRIDKTWEGVIVMFPACMLHQVYPFYTSEDYRISIAGNIKVVK